MSEEHSLALELNSLRTALDKYQAGHATHISSLQLQRAHLNVADAIAHSRTTEAENERLKREVAFLRANPEPSQTPRQITELSLALRRVSDKLSLTENKLLQKNMELASAFSEKNRMQFELKAALVEADKARRLADDAMSRERELQTQCRAAVEEAKMADNVVLEYADLVRSLESKLFKLQRRAEGIPEADSTSRKQGAGHRGKDIQEGIRLAGSSMNTDTPISFLAENRMSLQRLFEEFNSGTTALQSEISQLRADVTMVRNELDAERETSTIDKKMLAEAQLEIERYKADDQAATKIVSRYMRFSQSSIDMLQTALSSLKERHTRTLSTLTSSSDAIAHALNLERKRAAQLRDILDQLTEDISRETFGRRREIALRLRGLTREEKIVSGLRSWLIRAEEHRARLLSGNFTTVAEGPYEYSSPRPSIDAITILGQMIEDAKTLVTSMSLQSSHRIDGSTTGSLGRIVLAEQTCASLTEELQKEIEKRLVLTKNISQNLFNTSCPAPLTTIVNLKETTEPTVASTLDAAGTTTDISPTSMSAGESKDPGISGPSLLQDAVQLNEFSRGGPDLTSQQPPHTLDEKQGDNTLPMVHSVSVSCDETPRAEDIFAPLPPDAETSRLEPTINEPPHVVHRYDDLQRAFRGCHQELAHMKASIAPEVSSPAMSLIQNVINRLDDFCEDASVELEIRIADGERIARGYETMLRIPGALASRNEERMRQEWQAFLDGTAPSVVKTYETYNSKLADLEHDIAQIKRALYKLEEAVGTEETDSPPYSSKWSSWAPPFLSSSVSSPPSHAPTFGTVITSPRSRRVSSTLFSSPRRASNDTVNVMGDPYAHLELRIPMPSQISSHSSPHRSPSSRLRESRSMNGIYLLGLGPSNSGLMSKHGDMLESESGLGDDSDTHSNSDIE